MFNINVEQVISIHTELIKEFGGLSGIKSRNLLESAILSPQQGYYEDDVEIIGAIVYGICMNHPFNDGNKRVAALVGEYLLNEINKELNMTNDEYEQLIWELADGKLSKEQLTNIIKKNVI